MKGVLLATAAVGAAALAWTARAADLVGSEACKPCHESAYVQWKQSKHARSQASLSPLQAKDQRCLSCHAPNLGDQNVPEVSCETCHGGGQYYGVSYVMKDDELSRLVGLVDPSEKACRACHDASSPSLKPFDFVEKLRLIDHWTAERQRRAEAAVDEKKK